MLKSKTPVIVGLSVFDSEYLKLSVTGLGRVRKNFRLIIHNNNPEQKITTRQIRRLGYRGKLSIINSGANVGQMGAQMMILNHIKLKKFVAPWIMMINQTDIPTQIIVPNVAPDKFAIIQNRIVIKSGLGNVLTAIRDPKQCNIRTAVYWTDGNTDKNRRNDAFGRRDT